MIKRTLTPAKVLSLLTQLEASPENYLTLYLRPDSPSDYLAKLTELPSVKEIREAFKEGEFLEEAQRYGTGLVAFWGEGENRYLLLPPFPITEERVLHGRPETSLLRHLLEQEHLLGLILVTWGSYAIGLFEGKRLVDYKTGTGYIHKRTRKGGRSEKRFARRTEEQKKDFLRRVANRIDERFAGIEPEQIFFGGNRLILKPLLEESRYLKSRAERISKRFINARYADRQALTAGLRQIELSLLISY